VFVTDLKHQASEVGANAHDKALILLLFVYAKTLNLISFCKELSETRDVNLVRHGQQSLC
jgi:hypothetical protein